MVTSNTRVFLAVLSICLAILSARDARLAYQGTQISAELPRIHAGNPQFDAEAVEKLLARPADFAAQANQVLYYTRAALAREPLQAVAMRQLGMAAAIGNAEAGPAQWRLAERISRRDLANQLLLIDAEARQGHVEATLEHYNRAQLVYPGSSQKLLPVLSGALGEPAVRRGLAIYAQQAWFADLVSNALRLGADPSSLVDLLANAWPRIHAGAQQGMATSAIAQLVPRAEFGMIRELARRVPALKALVIGPIGFSPATTDPAFAPLSWSLVNQDGIEATMDTRHGLVIRMASEQSGLVAERVTLLPPGSYQLTVDLEHMSATPSVQLVWDIACLGGPAPARIWHGAWPAASASKGFIQGLTIPEGCAAQQWRLTGIAELSQAPSVTRVARLEVLQR